MRNVWLLLSVGVLNGRIPHFFVDGSLGGDHYSVYLQVEPYLAFRLLYRRKVTTVCAVILTSPALADPAPLCRA